jgi:catechol 2,3-dioxygenase-like lactoylglutathione lyase family enzyme
MIDHINAIVLAVRDVEKCALFYRDKLGFNLDQLERDEAYLTIGSGGGIVLALKSLDLLANEISQERIRPRQEGVKRTHCVVFVTDLDAEYSDLSRKGVHFLNPPKTLAGGWRTAHFEDPEDNLWEIAQRPSV